jgi:hypothetical protein
VSISATIGASAAVTVGQRPFREEMDVTNVVAIPLPIDELAFVHETNQLRRNYCSERPVGHEILDPL